MTGDRFNVPRASTTYRVAPDPHSGATPLYMIVVEEGWRQTILCSGMYEWAAEWLAKTLQGKAFHPGGRP